MTKQEAIWAMEEGKKVRHRYFAHDEYIFQKDLHIISEDGVTHDSFWEQHTGEAYESDWEIVPDDIIQIEIQERRKAQEINSRNSGKYYLVEEIELGVGVHKKAVRYTEGTMKKGVHCKALIISPGKVRIIL